MKSRDLRRKLKTISEVGASALPQEKLDRYNSIKTKMSKIYSTAKVPSYKDKTKMMSLDPDIRDAVAKSTDPEELEHYFTEFRKATGRELRDLYLEYIELINEAARWAC